MAAFGVGDQVSAAVPPGGAAGFGTFNAPNFVGELFFLSPQDTPLLTLSGGLTGGMSAAAPLWTWQDTLHRAPAIQAGIEGDDATFTYQKRNERVNVATIHQYGVELTYTKQSAVGLLGTAGGAGVTTPATGAENILGTQPVQDEMSAQLRIKIEQAALDVEKLFLDGTLAYPIDGTARQTQGIVGAVSGDTTTDYTLVSGQEADRTVVNDLMRKLAINGAPMRNCVLMVGALSKEELGNNYSTSTSGWNVQPRSYNVFGVTVTDLNTEFGTVPVLFNRHLDVDTVLIVDLDVFSPRFMPIKNKGHFFVEPLAKSGSYDRAQLYGEIGNEYGPSGWHAKAFALHAP